MATALKVKKIGIPVGSRLGKVDRTPIRHGRSDSDSVWPFGPRKGRLDLDSVRSFRLRFVKVNGDVGFRDGVEGEIKSAYMVGHRLGKVDRSPIRQG